MRVSYRVITPASVSPLRSNLLSPLDTTYYSTRAYGCQEGNFNFLKFFRLNPDGSDPPLSRFPLDTTHYSTFDGDCQEGILVFFFSTARSHLHLGHYLPLAQPTGSHPLLTLCIVPQVGTDYNRQITQVSGKINKKICVKKLLTKLLAGCIMVNSGRDARNRPAIIPHPGAFVNRENYTKK